MSEAEGIQKQREIFRAMSPEMRLKQASKLRKMAWELKSASFRKSCPKLSEAEIQKLTRDAFLYART